MKRQERYWKMEDKKKYDRILIVRTDRIGDVILSTPVIRAFREAYPKSYIAFMTGPATKDIVSGNPYLDEVIVYDKNGAHKNWVDSIKFALDLRRRKFDLAIILHPTNRAHIVSFLAGIKERVGYDKKSGFLLTKKTPDMKFEGIKHEADYALDLAKLCGVKAVEKELFMAIKEQDKESVKIFLKNIGLKDGEKIVAMNPGASCPSKIWPAERFAQVADALAKESGARIILVSGKEDVPLARKVQTLMRQKPIFLAGKTSLGELAALLKMCSLFISNDSGPVHIAVAVGTPVISIFGRRQPGLGPTRWKPLGEKDIVFHKYVGCAVCLAHNCKQGFRCLLSITAQEVINSAKRLLNSSEPAAQSTALSISLKKDIVKI